MAKVFRWKLGRVEKKSSGCRGDPHLRLLQVAGFVDAGTGNCDWNMLEAVGVYRARITRPAVINARRLFT